MSLFWQRSPCPQMDHSWRVRRFKPVEPKKKTAVPLLELPNAIYHMEFYNVVWWPIWAHCVQTQWDNAQVVNCYSITTLGWSNKGLWHLHFDLDLYTIRVLLSHCTGLFFVWHTRITQDASVKGRFMFTLTVTATSLREFSFPQKVWTVVL